ncbi:Transmembrane protein like [Quillaja saponaria]|uniref:Transmembrane protein like n=1 Tax=Quillaja saponaria TaxID=32244 RepID=A0AAD7KMC5_QUISA|nr:Transmembrane protein like [Quillaja saponaria]
MGTLVGHVAPGFGFLLIGLWHLFNHIKLHALNTKSYISLPWFPTIKFKYMELLLIMGGCSASIAMELFISPERHQPLDPDWTIPSNHLHNFEHSSISMTFFVYAAFSIILDRMKINPNYHHHLDHDYGLTQLLAAIAFAQELLLFHLHSADHMGPEGQYHLLLQLLILVSLITTLMGIGLPKSFLVSFLRSLSILFQGLWLIVMGIMLWTPDFVPKGCFLHLEEGHQVVRCSGEESLHRAKSLINIQFSWFLIGITVFAVIFYLILLKFYYEKKKSEYVSLTKDLQELQEEEEEEEHHDSSQLGDFDLESRNKKPILLGNANSFLQMGKSFGPIDMER